VRAAINQQFFSKCLLCWLTILRVHEHRQLRHPCLRELSTGEDLTERLPK
jgi:hypothetical protein